MKKCNKCLIVKENNEFGKRKDSKDGLKHFCISCETVRLREYSRTVDGNIARTLANQRRACKKRGHEAPIYNKEELKEWLLSQDNYSELNKKWEESNYEKNLRPSIDRKDDSKGYTLDNIQLMTWRENSLKNSNDRLKGKPNHGGNKHLAVIQIKDSIEINEYISLREAERKTGIPHGNISKCCNNTGAYKSAGGFNWKFKEVVQ